MPRCSMFVTQPNAIIGQLSIVRYALNATNSPSVMRPLNDLAAAEPQHEQRAQAEKERHARKEEPLQHDQPAVAGDDTRRWRAGTARVSAASCRYARTTRTPDSASCAIALISDSCA